MLRTTVFAKTCVRGEMMVREMFLVVMTVSFTSSVKKESMRTVVKLTIYFI